MPRWLLWTPVAALTAAMALFGLRAGVAYTHLSESDVINRAAQSYLSGGQDRSASDCSARPSQQDRVWLVVTCQAAGGTSETYSATRFGDLRLAAQPAAQPET